MIINSNQANQHYSDILENLKTYFPSPLSDPIMDGYFIHTISRFIGNLDRMKCKSPLLGIGLESCRPTLHDVGKEKLPILPRTKQRQTEKKFPIEMGSLEKVTDLLSDYCQDMIVWGHPNSQVNVTPPSSISSIMAFIAAAIYNPNIISDESSGQFSDAEIETIEMVSDLIGYDSQKSGGLFTFGGTGTILYGCKLGIEKILGGKGMTEGIHENLKIVTSDISHYSHLNVASWLGIGTKNLVIIPTTNENEMSLIDLEDNLRRALERKEKIATIIATMGTTDAFGIDDIYAIVKLRDQLTEEYELKCPPHIHADAVIGWIWMIFKDYDFRNNPLGFHARTMHSLQDSLMKMSSLYMADSVGIDFHKTGYAPYISSAFLVKNRGELTLFSRSPDQMPYLYKSGHYHPGIYTLETSRPGTGALAALANIRLFAKQGYRVLIGHIVEMAEMLRERLEEHKFIRVLNNYNYGPVTLFRVYPDGINTNEIFQQEMNNIDYRKQTEENNAYNLKIFNQIYEQAFRGEGVLLSWTDAYRHAEYTDSPPISAIKSYIMSPWTDLNAVDTVVRQVIYARDQI
jgi:glutamate/tyrosine decarboxylase-like PLP-dependent enzyme